MRAQSSINGRSTELQSEDEVGDGEEQKEDKADSSELEFAGVGKFNFLSGTPPISMTGEPPEGGDKGNLVVVNCVDFRCFIGNSGRQIGIFQSHLLRYQSKYPCR